MFIMVINSIKVTRFMVSWGKVTKNSHEVKCCPKNCIAKNTLRKIIQKKIMILEQLQILSRLQKFSVRVTAGFAEIQKKFL